MKSDIRDIIIFIHVISALITVIFPAIVSVGSIRLYSELRQGFLSFGSFKFFRTPPTVISRINYLLPVTGLLIVLMSHYGSNAIWLLIGAVCWVINIGLLEVGILKPWRYLSTKLKQHFEAVFIDENDVLSFKNSVTALNYGISPDKLRLDSDRIQQLIQLKKEVIRMFYSSILQITVLFSALYMMIRQP